MLPALAFLLPMLAQAASEAADSLPPQEPFAVVVVGYDPAPGQNVRNAAFNDPWRAVGTPVGGGTQAANQTSLVTLGGFGGSITLGFDHTVMDDPLNPFGVDAIVFGNAFWAGGDPDRHFAECAVIEICLDVHGDECATGPWYLIPGSHVSNAAAQYASRTWDDDVADDTYPPADEAWIPPGRTGVWQTWSYELPDDPFAGDNLRVVTNPLAGSGLEGIHGYAEYSPTLLLGDLDSDNVVDDPAMTPGRFYTVPDDPMVVGMTPACSGGDAFDIGWAVDPQTGVPVGLTGFDFIRITNGVDEERPPLGETSPEIDAVADVAVDPFGDVDDDGDIDLRDIAGLQDCFGGAAMPGGACERLDRAGDGTVARDDGAAQIARMTGPR